MQKLGTLKLMPAVGFPGARGRFTLLARPCKRDGLAFRIHAHGLPPNSTSDYAPDAYGVWLTGGGRDHFLGFTPFVTKRGRFAVSGPRQSDKTRFRHWLMHARRIRVTRETIDRPKRHGKTVLYGHLND